MKIETFFEKFDLFVDAPDAIPAMREVVLQLAVRGHLTERIRGEASKPQLDLVDAFRVRRNKKSHFKEEDIPFAIPETWGWAAVGDSMDMINGRAFKPEEWSPEGTPIIRIQNLNNENAPFNRCKSDLDSKIHVHDGDFLISWSGTPGTSFGAFIWKRGFAYLNQHIFRCELVEGVFEKEFLRLAINARLDEMISHAQGAVGLRHITKGKLESIRLPLPPLTEQKRIVAKVEELMAVCDRLEAQQREREEQAGKLSRAALARFAEAPTPANLELLFHPSFDIPPADLRKSILTLAVQGKLVPQDPNEETAEESLARLGIEKTLSSDEGDDSLPSSWTRVRFEDVALTTGGVTLGRKLGDRQAITLPYLRVANVKRGELDLGIIKEVTIAEDEIKRYALRENDLLMTEGGDWDKVGRAAIWRGEIPICLHQNHVFRSRMRSTEISPVWFERYFNSPNGRRYFESASKQTTNLASINMRQVRGCPIPFPPLAEQRRIVAKVDELMALVDTLEVQLADSRVTAEKLLAALVEELVASAGPSSGSSRKPLTRHFARAVLSAEIVHHLHAESTFGRIKHQKIFHLCEYIAQISEIEGHYHREAAGPLDNRLIYGNEGELKKQKWYDTVPRERYGHAYAPMEKAGAHEKYLESFGAEKRETIGRLIATMKKWDTDRCEIFSTAYAAWNDLIIWKQEPTEEAVLHEILERWNPAKKRFSRDRWLAAIHWMRDQDFAPTGFGKPTA